MTISQLFDEQGVEPFSLSLEDIIFQSAGALEPSDRMTVSQAAEKYRYINNVGSYTGWWKNETTPYLVEPMDELTNRLYESVVFAGPAQCGKTDMFLNYLAYTVMCDPADLTLVQTVQATARDFSITRVDRMHTQSEKVGERLITDNVYDKQYRNGMILRLSWPTVNELSGKPIPRLWLTDYDRMTMDVDGEGTPFAMAKARTTSFKKNGKVAAESSPGFMISDPQWHRTSPHEAPPCEGILSLYNAGDRRRWYWRCVEPDCNLPFEPTWDLIKYPDTADPVEAGEAAFMICPHCGTAYHHDRNAFGPSKAEMNARGRWLKEGEIWLPSGEIVGKPRRAVSASFWLQGVAAAFNSWKQLVTDFRAAEEEFEKTGKEDTLKTVVNTKLGMAYLPKALAVARIADVLKSRAMDFGMKVVPHGVRFLLATIDVQGNRFEVQVHGIGEHDIWIVDRFQIRYSKRRDPENPSQFKPIDPGAHPEDWRHILYEVMEKTYPLIDNPDRHMAVFQTFSDSAGSKGFTANAYDFVRWLNRGYDESADPETKDLYPWKPGFGARFMLVKGEPKPSAPRVKIDFPDSERKDRMASARGEIPVCFINSNVVKNQLNTILDRVEPGGPRVMFPNWLPISFYKELTVETKGKDGKWENLTGHRNESWDLLVYCLAGLLLPTIGWEHIRWDDPPVFAASWDEGNSMIFDINGSETPFIQPEEDAKIDFAALGASLNS